MFERINFNFSAVTLLLIVIKLYLRNLKSSNLIAKNYCTKPIHTKIFRAIWLGNIYGDLLVL